MSGEVQETEINFQFSDVNEQTFIAGKSGLSTGKTKPRSVITAQLIIALLISLFSVIISIDNLTCLDGLRLKLIPLTFEIFKFKNRV